MSVNPSVLQTDKTNEYYTDERCHILELSNVASDPEVSIARARVEPGVTTKLHRVSNTVERYVILEGLGCIQVEGLDETAVNPGDVVVIPAGTPQSISNVGENDLIFLCICTPRFEWENYAALE